MQLLGGTAAILPWLVERMLYWRCLRNGGDLAAGGCIAAASGTVVILQLLGKRWRYCRGLGNGCDLAAVGETVEVS